MQYGPNPDAIYPNEAIKSVCFIKNVITRPNILVGDYTTTTTSTARSALRSTSPIIMSFWATSSSSENSVPSPRASSLS